MRQRRTTTASPGKHRVGVDDAWAPATVYARYVGRVGALAVALGVGVAVTTGHGLGLGVARAQTDTDSAGTQSSDTPTDAATAAEAGTSDPGAEPDSDPDGPPPSGSTIDNPSAPQMNQNSSGGLVESDGDDGGDGADGVDGAVGADGTDAVVSDAGPSLPTTDVAPDVADVSDGAPASGGVATSNKQASQRNSMPMPFASEPTEMGLVGNSGQVSFETLSVAPSGQDSGQRWLSGADSARVAGAQQELMAAGGQESARTTVLEPSPQVPPAGVVDAVVDVANTFVAALLSPFVTPGPDTPAQIPLFWAVLGWINRETKRTLGLPTTPTVEGQQTTMVLGTVAPQALRVAAVARNKAPIAIIDTYQSTEDTALSVTGPGLLGNDFDLNGDALSAQLDTDAKHGIVTLAADGSFTYTPAAQYSGRDSFYYNVSDGVATKRGKVLINIAAVNDVPAAAPDAYSTVKSTKLTVKKSTGVLANDTDPDGPQSWRNWCRAQPTECWRSNPTAHSPTPPPPATAAPIASRTAPATASPPVHPPPCR